MKVQAYGEVYDVNLQTVGVYSDGTPCVRLLLDDGSPFGTLTVCIEGAKLEKDEILVKTWSENADLAQAVRESCVYVDTGKRVSSGYCVAEVWKIR